MVRQYRRQEWDNRGLAFAPRAGRAAAGRAEGKLQAAAEEQGQARRPLDFGNWKALVTFGAGGRNNRMSGNSTPIGRTLVAKLGEKEFLVTCAYGKVDFAPATGAKRDSLRVLLGM